MQIRLSDIGISVVNDKSHEELLFVSLNKSKVIWTESKRFRMKPIDNELDEALEKLYVSHSDQREAHPDDRELLRKKYNLPEYPVCILILY